VVLFLTQVADGLICRVVFYSMLVSASVSTELTWESLPSSTSYRSFS